MSEYLIQDETLSLLGAATRQKAGVEDKLTPHEMIREIFLLETDTDTGGPANGVTFYDYDGTVLYHYTVREARALTALPEGPVHDDVTFDGWTHTLEEVTSVMKSLDVGALYTCDDTIFFLDNGIPGGTINFNYCQSVAGGITIDWGDGTSYTNSTLSGSSSSSLIAASHSYSDAGKSYTIRFITNDGYLYMGYWSDVDKTSIYSVSGNYTYPGHYYITRAIFGKNVHPVSSRKSGATHSMLISDCNNLASIILSNGVSDIYGSALFRTNKLKCAIIPPSITCLGDECFDYSGVEKVIFGSNLKLCPDDEERYSYRVFGRCEFLKSIIIPETTTDILTALGMVTGTGSLEAIYLRHMTPPEISATNLGNICSDYPLCKFYVPIQSLEAYKTADGWSDYADRIVGEPPHMA